MWGRFVARLNYINDAYGRFMERIGNPTSNRDFVFGFLLVAGFWAFAWNAHIIGPWVDNLMGWGPHDIDSAGKIRWRRMWSTALCLPGLGFLAVLYIRTWRERHHAEK